MTAIRMIGGRRPNARAIASQASATDRSFLITLEVLVIGKADDERSLPRERANTNEPLRVVDDTRHSQFSICDAAAVGLTEAGFHL
jgi:hypothetical protein